MFRHPAKNGLGSVQHSCSSLRFNHRDLASGFTIIELLVAITVIGILIALILPAVVNARGTARRMQCQSNLRNIGVALQEDVDQNRRFPAAGYFSFDGKKHYRSWVIGLLPWLEQSAIYNKWDFDRSYFTDTNRELGDTHISILACPDDFTVVPGKGNLSYAVNGGFGWTVPVDCPVTYHAAATLSESERPIDLNGDGVFCPISSSSSGSGSDRHLFLQTGMFFIENWPHNSGTLRHHKMSSILDGASQTITISENVRAGFDPYFPVSGWSSPEPRRNSFILSGYVCRNLSCTKENVDYSKANDHSGDPFRSEAINSPLNQPEGEAPRPSSGHSGGVNALYADGHVAFLTELVDGAVYAGLLSPQGSSIGGPLRQTVLSAGP